MVDYNTKNQFEQVLQVVREQTTAVTLASNRIAPYRFLYWELLLDTKDQDLKEYSFKQYVESKHLEHQDFLQLREQVKIYHNVLREKNPLQTAQSTSAKNESLNVLSVIEKDIERTYQELELFHNKAIHKLLFDVLSIWDMKNLDVQYRQGMNEILGLLVIVYFEQYSYSEDTESRLFWMFSRLMCKQREMFMPIGQGPIQDRIKMFQNYYLKQVDMELFRFFKFEEFQIQVFMLRWFRCMLAREFDTGQIKIIWDHMILNYRQSSNFFFIDCYSISMIANIRDKILYNGNPSIGLQMLLNYPCKDDFEFLLQNTYNLQTMLHVAQQTNVMLDRKRTFCSPSEVIMPDTSFFDSSHFQRRSSRFASTIMPIQQTYRPEGLVTAESRNHCLPSMWTPFKQIQNITSRVLTTLQITKKRSSTPPSNIELSEKRRGQIIQ